VPRVKDTSVLLTRRCAALRQMAKGANLWLMKLRLDLLEHYDGRGHHGGGGGEQSPLQARAAFFKNWNWRLSPTSTEHSAREVALNTELIRKVEARQAQAGKAFSSPGE